MNEAALSIREAVMQRDANAIRVTLCSVTPISAEQLEGVRRAMERALPGLALSLDVLEAAEAAQDADPESHPERPVLSASAAVAPTAPKGEPGCRVLLGRTIRGGRITPISALAEGNAAVTIAGSVVSAEAVESFAGQKDDKFRLRINLTDYTNSIHCACALPTEDKRRELLTAALEAGKKGGELVVRGVCKVGRFGKELQVFVNDINVRPANLRNDSASDKRVELHLHTKMSTMDGLTDVEAAFLTAKRFGHRALAITDHGVVQSFPDAAKASKKTGVKAIFGLEGYLLPDTELIGLDRTFVVFDIETTGLKPEQCEIIEIGAVKLQGGRVVDRFSTFIDNGAVIPSYITELTRITNGMVAGAPGLRDALSAFGRFCEGCVLVAHNARFDMGFVQYHGAKVSLPFEIPFADTLMLARYLLPGLPNYKLDTVCGRYGVDISGHHRAVDDAEATAQVFGRLIDELRTRGIATVPVTSVLAEHETGKKKGRHIKTNHIILLARTQAGLKNLYRLVSRSHLDHFRTKPLIPKSLLSIYREGLLLGSACEQGELYQAALAGADDETLARIAAQYDYLEIQPLCNNAFLVRGGTVTSDEALRSINQRIVSLGERLNIPVVATGDVHFLEPHDADYRKILMCKLGYADAEQQAPLYFKTTDEMLEEFSYLGAETARRVVIDAPNEIADRCGALKPFPDGTHAPKIENAERELTGMALARAHELYGDPLPAIVQARLDRELNSIIGNGFASLYLMAQRLVHKSLSDGYLVGSRGSVGSSFVATMAGITEVNPLRPHYVCPNCKHSDFDIDRLLYACGVDMPDQNCPVCGTQYGKAGYDIPFEVFLGFDGDKTPDIDLNFSGEYQPVAHKYVEEMFGAGHAFRAGTISGLAERKAYECIQNYMEVTGKTLRRAEQERLCQGCLDVKVTTGQHPGGIVIVPKDEDILDFTPIQYPADKVDRDTVTTHFDFHAMDDRLVKLDILGHDDPTALRLLEELTGVDPKTLPLDDPETMRIFSTSEPLGVDLSELGCSIGTLGVPEFGTGFVRGVLEATRPTQMEELIRIAGLTHGTDVWLNNAEPLVMNGIAKLSEVICTRDDIMNYLIAHGMEAKLSFTIMERVRKGKGLTPEMEKALNDQQIPAWFIDSCKKIKYMFPRGHAVAYATMSYRIAYYKVHHPLAFYAVYFTVRADAFDVTMAFGGEKKVLATIRALEKAAQSADFAEKKRNRELQTILEVVYEMNLRGICLLPVDLYRSQGTKFTIEDGAIRPAFNTVPGVGNTAASALVFKRGEPPYLSVEDFQKRTGANSAVVGMLEKCGCLTGLPQKNQISLFELA